MVQLFDLGIRQGVFPDAEIVDDSIHVLIGTGVADGHGLAPTHESRLAFEGDSFFAIAVEVEPTLLLGAVDDKGDQEPTLDFEIAALAIGSDIVLVEIDTRLDPARAIADVAVHFVGIDLHVEIELAPVPCSQNSREGRFLGQANPGGHCECPDLEVGRVGDADVIPLGPVEQQCLAQLAGGSHRPVDDAVVGTCTVLGLATRFLKFPMGDGSGQWSVLGLEARERQEEGTRCEDGNGFQVHDGAPGNEGVEIYAHKSF